MDDWDPVLAPTTRLRKWFGHEPENFANFAGRYEKEFLRKKTAKAKMQQLPRISKNKTVTLVYSARNETHDNAVVLARLLAKHCDASVDPGIANLPSVHR